jgi:DNA-binding LytR/AlgR family response regulator
MSKTINCLIIEDEPLARDLIRTFLAGAEDFRIAKECANAADGYEALLNNDIDVIFLDIQMPVLTGMDFLRSLKRPPKIVFTTAHANYAADAFNLDVVDYLVKPIGEDRFRQALVKLRTALQQTAETPPVDVVVNYTFIKVDAKLVKVQFSDILYLEALKDFTKVHLKEAKPLLVGSHLKSVEKQLPAADFVRIHRSYLVSVHSITRVFGNTVEIGLTELPIGSSYKDQLLERLYIK